MALYRCQNANCSEDPAGRLIYDFESNEPANLVCCPKCKTLLHDREYPNIVVKREVIHFEPPSKIYGKGLGFIACMPDTKIRGSGIPSNIPVRRTGVPGVVNCKKCLATPIMQELDKITKALEEGDFEVYLSLKDKMFIRPDQPKPQPEAVTPGIEDELKKD